MSFKILNSITDTNLGINTITSQRISESRVEDLKKVEKFISPQKLQEFWRGTDFEDNY